MASCERRAYPIETNLGITVIESARPLSISARDHIPIVREDDAGFMEWKID